MLLRCNFGILIVIMRQLFYRNAQARDHLELFLVSAISSLLLLRFYLYLTGYPQVGGDSLHIAHMLYGGLLMMAAIVINLSFLGIRSERVAALVGGVGFGVFIDELGKFITKDNNYFYQPTVGLIYAIFCVLYLTFNFLSRRQRLTSEEYQLNALRQFEEAVLKNMDPNEKAAMQDLLARADQGNFITKELTQLLKHVQTVPVDDSRLLKIHRKVTDGYRYFWHHRGSNRLV
ncbi:MAG: putative rane protein, partial [Candidatus Saccharibacteria bacterium]|nr:putative rane protein [Candidatus Saccharibacteria bacterium]